MRQLHPMTPPYRGFARGVSFGSLFFFLTLIGGDAIGLHGTGPAVIAGTIGILLGGGYEVAYYRRFGYELTADTFDIASGVISRRRREIPLRRIQNVDIERNVIQRILGVAELRLETAGGGQTEARLQYVGYDEAKRLQRDIRRQKQVVEEEHTDETADEPIDRPEREERVDADEEEELFELTPRELVLLSVLSFDAGFGFFFGVVLPTLFIFGAASPEGLVGLVTNLSGFALVALGLAALIVVGIAWIVSAGRTFARHYGFQLSRVGDELRYERGLLQRYDGSIPIDKVQTLTIHESLLKRQIGYATLGIETAGYSPGQAPSGGSEAAVPLATRGRVNRLANEIEPIGVVEFERPPKRARRRYAARYTIVIGIVTGVLFAADALVGTPAAWYAPLVLLVLVPLAAHLKWTNRGYHADDEYFVARNGFWRRTTRFVPHYRIQTVVDTRTFIQRRWRLASVTADTAGSMSLVGQDATAVDYDENDAADLRELLARRLQERLHLRKEKRREREMRVGRERVVEEVSGPIRNDEDRTPSEPHDGPSDGESSEGDSDDTGDSNAANAREGADDSSPEEGATDPAVDRGHSDDDRPSR